MTEERLWAMVQQIDGKIDDLIRSVAEMRAGAVDRQRQIDVLARCSEALTHTVEMHGKSIDRHEYWLGLLRWGVVTLAVPVVGYLVNLVIRALEGGARVP